MQILRAPATVRGVGLFTGADTSVTFEPATPGSGLRIAINDGEPFPATTDHLSDEPVHELFERAPARHTALRDPSSGRSVYTVEHALATMVGLDVHDAVIRVRAVHAKVEAPIMDGSAKAFVDAVLGAGLLESLQNDTSSPIAPRGVVRMPSDPDPDADPPPMAASVRSLGAGERTTYAYTLDYTDTFSAMGLPEPHPIPAGTARWTLGDREAFVREIAPARTFSLRQEVEPLRAMGLFERFAPTDLLVIGADGPIDNAWRYPDEAARHKLLDLIGDLALAGRAIAGHAEARGAGHGMNHALARALRNG